MAFRRICCSFALFAMFVFGQNQLPPGFVRGVITLTNSATLTVQTSSGDSFQYRTDAKTWIERDHDQISASSLKPGEILEVVSDRDPEPVRYARMIHVISPTAPRPRPVSTGGVFRLKPEPPLPALIFTGIIIARDPNRLILRTRFDGDKAIYLHADSQCLEDGNIVPQQSLAPLLQVQITAVPNTDHELIATSIIWGRILQPRP